MIFTFPVAISENIDRRYLKGILKTLELNYLSYIADSIQSGKIQFYMHQKIGGKVSGIKIEDVDHNDSIYKVLTEQHHTTVPEPMDREPIPPLTGGESREELEQLLSWIEREISVAENYIKILKDDISAEQKRQGTNKAQVNQNILDGWKTLLQEWNERLGDLKALQRQASDRLERIKEREKRSREDEKEREKRSREDEPKEKEKRKPPTVSVSTDTQQALDMRPTMMTIQVQVLLKGKKGETEKTETRSMPIGVKVMPIKMKNLNKAKDVFIDDYFTKSFYKLVKRLERGFIRAIFNKFVAPIYKKFDLSKDFGIWVDDIFGRKGDLSASSFYHNKGHQVWSSAIIIFDESDFSDIEAKEDVLNNPKQISAMFKMGWNTFGIMDNKNKEFDFCFRIDRGYCVSVSYSYLFKSIQAQDVYQDLDKLQSYTGKIFGNIKKVSSKKWGNFFEKD